jgi:hypothetical protein
MFRPLYFLGCALLLFAPLVGCGESGPELAPVSGRVTLDGRPLENADVTFQPEGAERPSMGRTDKDGRYQLAYKRGVMGARVAWHNVNVSVSPELVRNPPRIAKTELRVEVKPDTQNEFNFDLASERP